MKEARLKVEKSILKLLFAEKVGSITGIFEKRTGEPLCGMGGPHCLDHGSVVSINVGDTTVSFDGTADDVIKALPELKDQKNEITVSVIKPGHKNNGWRMTLGEYCDL